VFLFTPSTAARSRAGGKRSPGRASPSVMARTQLGSDLIVESECLAAVDLDLEHGTRNTSFIP